MNNSILYDINHQYVKAVEEYELEINQGEIVSEEHYINLAFLYWSFAFQKFEFQIPFGIPEEYAIIGGEKYQITIDNGKLKYANSLELRFWGEYFKYYQEAFEGFGEKECLEIINSFPQDDNTIPYFYLYLFDKVKYLKERNVLLEKCLSHPTAKNNWIKSIIEN